MTIYEYRCYDCRETYERDFARGFIECPRCGGVANRKYPIVGISMPSKIDDEILSTGESPYDYKRSSMEAC